MRRRALLATIQTESSIHNNKIWYTALGGDVVTPYNTNVFGATIISNVYNNGIGVITFDDSVTSIGNSAFASCDNLISITIPDSVTTIGVGAFRDCENLENVTIPDSVTSIGNSAFASCDRLTSATIGDNVTTIGSQAFFECRRLTSVYCKAITPPALDGTAIFYGNSSSLKIYVPVGSVNVYKRATGWSKYASNIVGYNF